MATKNIFSNISGTVVAAGLLVAPTYFNGTQQSISFKRELNKLSKENVYEFNGTDSNLKYGNNYIVMDYSYRTLEQEAEELFGPMREATSNEQRSVEDYIKSISVNTGVKFF